MNEFIKIDLLVEMKIESPQPNSILEICLLGTEKRCVDGNLIRTCEKKHRNL